MEQQDQNTETGYCCCGCIILLAVILPFQFARDLLANIFGWSFDHLYILGYLIEIVVFFVAFCVVIECIKIVVRFFKRIFNFLFGDRGNASNYNYSNNQSNYSNNNNQGNRSNSQGNYSNNNNYRNNQGSYNNNNNQNYSNAQSEEQQKFEFFSAVSRVAGYIARAGGTITRNQIKIMSDLFDDLEIDLNTKKQFQQEFNIGKAPDFRPDRTCHLLSQYVRTDRNLGEGLVDFLLSIIYADSIITAKEMHAFYEIINLVGGISQSYVKSQIDRYESGRRQSSSSNSNHQYSQGSSSNNQRNSNYNQGSRSNNQQNSQSNSNQNKTYNNGDYFASLAEALAYLGLPSTATLEEASAAKKKIQIKCHPDKLKAQGITDPKEIEKAQNKSQMVNVAYDYIEERLKGKS